MKTQEKKRKQAQRTDKKVEESLSYMVEVTDKEGQVLQRISAPSRSYVEQWNQIVNVHADQVEKQARDTDGDIHTVILSAANFRANAGIGVTSYSLRVGKGTTAVAITDYALETPCEEGTSTDQFEHQLTHFTEPSVIGSTCSFTISRTMINNSGATITGIKEIGCYVYALAGAGTMAYMGFRDVLPSPVYVPDGGSITVTYTLKVTV